MFFLLDVNDRTKADHQEYRHDDPQKRAALLAFTFLKNVSTVSALTAWPLLAMLVDEQIELCQDFARIQPDEARIRRDEATDERLGRQLGVMIRLQRMELTDPDLRRRGDLLDRDPSLFALVAEELSQCELRVRCHRAFRCAS